jgi:internalin A
MPNHLRIWPLCALMLAAVPLYADDAEDQAVKAIEKLGGQVVRDDKGPARPVVMVDLGSTKVSDAGLKGLAPLKGLRELYLDHTPVTDEGLKELASLRSLQTLGLWNTQVSDAGLKELAPLKELQKLYLDGTQVSDAGLK